MQAADITEPVKHVVGLSTRDTLVLREVKLHADIFVTTTGFLDEVVIPRA